MEKAKKETVVVVIADSVQFFLAKSVEMVRQCNRTDVNGFCSLEDFVLQMGKPMQLAKRPSGLRRGPLKQCYQTATQWVLEDPSRFIYCEGYAAGLIPVMHAWVIDSEGGVIETTWRKEWGTKYFGVAIKSEFLLASLRGQERYGLIDQPEGKWPMLRSKVKAWRHPIMDKL